MEKCAYSNLQYGRKYMHKVSIHMLPHTTCDNPLPYNPIACCPYDSSPSAAVPTSFITYVAARRRKREN